MELKIEDLSLEEKIGQMIIVGIDGNKITELFFTEKISNHMKKW